MEVTQNLAMYDGYLLQGRVEGDANETLKASVPFESIQTLISNQATAVQKQTALKVLEKFFRNVETKNFKQQVNFDEELTTKINELQYLVAEGNDLKEILMKQIADWKEKFKDSDE